MGQSESLNIKAPRKALKTIYKESSVLGKGGIDFGNVVLIIGKTDVGKSVFAFDLAFDLSAGRNIFGGVQLRSALRTYLVLLESSDADLAKMEDGIKKFGNYTKAQKTYSSRRLFKEKIPEDWSTDFFKELQRSVNEGMQAIVIDNLNFIPNAKTSSGKVAAFIQKAKKILGKTAVLFIVTHTPKTESNGHLSQRGKGPSEWGDMSRTTLNLKPAKYYENLIEATWTKKISSLIPGGNPNVYLARTNDDENRYFIEVAIKDKISKYTNKGFEFIPPSTRDDIESYIRDLKENDELLVDIDTKDIFDSISHIGDYSYLSPVDFEASKYHSYDRKTGFVKDPQKSIKLGDDTILWAGNCYEAMEDFNKESGRPPILTPLSPLWKMYVTGYTKKGILKIKKIKNEG